MEKKLDPASKQLILTLSLYWFAGALSGVFVNLFIWKQTLSFSQVVVFNLFIFIFLLIFYLASGYWLRKYSARTLVKFGIIILTAFYGCLVLFQEKALSLLVPLGMLQGTGEGLFWSGFNLHQYVHTQKTDRDYYFGVSGFWTGLLSIAGPLIGGSIITYGNNLVSGRFLGYYLLFSLTTIIFSLTLIVTKSFPRLSEVTFRAHHLKQIIMENANFRNILAQQGILGLKDVSIMTLSSILIFIVLTTEFNLGVYRSSISLLGALAGFLAGKILTENNRNKLTLFSAIVLTIGAFSLAISQNLLTLLVFGLSLVLGTILDISLGTLYFSVIDEDPKDWREKYAYFLARDGFLGIGRIVSLVLILLFFIAADNRFVARIWIAVAGSLSLVIWIFVKRMKTH